LVDSVLVLMFFLTASLSSIHIISALIVNVCMMLVLGTLLLFYLLLVIGTNATGEACGRKKVI
jgi:hypothetical protein